MTNKRSKDRSRKSHTGRNPERDPNGFSGPDGKTAWWLGVAHDFAKRKAVALGMMLGWTAKEIQT
jgi:hypothetical protein